MEKTQFDDFIENAEFYSHVEKVLKFGVFYFNQDFSEYNWSKGMYDLIGADKNLVFPDHDILMDLVIPAEREKAIKARQYYTSQGVDKFSNELSIIDFKGVLKRIKVYYNRISFYGDKHLEENSNEIFYKVIAKDITEKYNYQISLEEKIDLLDKSILNLEEFAYVASHDLQEPIRRISIYSERLYSKYRDNLDEEAVFYLERIEKSCNNMRTLLNDLLNYAKIENVSPQYVEVNLNEVVDTVLGDLEFKMLEARTKLEKKQLPAIYGIKSQLQQLFTNLIQNSLKFRKENIPSKIKIDYFKVNKEDFPELEIKDKEFEAISIEDNGIGFDQSYAEKIFKIFHRLNGKHEYSGSGIGLSICKKIMSNHNGYIFAQSKLNEGAKFILVFPKDQIIKENEDKDFIN